jgi:hypothetical protein
VTDQEAKALAVGLALDALPWQPEHWPALRGLTVQELKGLGCGSWDGRLMLFPGHWYDHIPVGLEVEHIPDTTNGFNKIEKFQRVEDNDPELALQFLAFGVPAADGVAGER